MKESTTIAMKNTLILGGRSERIGLFFCFTCLLLLHGCRGVNNPLKTLFTISSPRDDYEKYLKRTNLIETAIGQAWQSVGEAVLRDSLVVPLPYRERNSFGAENPAAFSYRFLLPAGRRVVIAIEKSTPDSLILFADLFRANANGAGSRLGFRADTGGIFTFQSANEEELLLRVQPALEQRGQFTVLLSTEPILGFPVAGRGNRDIGSFWGVPREGGRRTHEGIDIFAPKGTPVVAAADGVVSRVGQNNSGGNVVSVSPSDFPISLYYAHLDRQLVVDGQRVQRGDTLGTVGNTGNAEFTAAHLHFGIYRGFGGAIDPLPFVQKETAAAPTVASAAQKWLGDSVQTTQATPLAFAPQVGAVRTGLSKAAVLYAEGASGKWLRVRTKSGDGGFVAVAVVRKKKVVNL
jgi:peptidoglycan LD-endopeptidase LytH